MRNSKFSLAIQILVILSEHQGHFLSSKFLSIKLGKHPVLVRQIIGMLKQANLLQSKEGKLGGTQLSLNPKNINLYEVYKCICGKNKNFIPRIELPDKEYDFVVIRRSKRINTKLDLLEKSWINEMTKISIIDFL